MPVGVSEAIALWVVLGTLFLAAPLMAVAFYWRTPHPKAWAVVASAGLLYPVIWGGHWAFSSLPTGSETVVFLFYLPVVGSLLLAVGALYAVRTLGRRVGYLRAPAEELSGVR